MPTFFAKRTFYLHIIMITEGESGIPFSGGAKGGLPTVIFMAGF